jgi:hypothetical protein
VGGKELEK